MDLVFLAQWLGTICIVAFYPIQNWRLFLTRNPIGLSFLAFSFIAVGISGYLALGLHLGLVGLTVGNASNLIFATLILVIVWFRSPLLHVREKVLGLLVLAAGLGALITVQLAASPAFAQGASGWLGFAGIVAFYPVQNSDLFRKKDPTGLSLLAFVSLAIGLACYTLLGFLVNDVTIIAGNGVSLLGSLPIIYMIVRYQNRMLQKVPA